MADLDDFFAKKDKKKSKSKPKFLTAEELVKNLEDTKREVVAAAKVKKVESSTNNGAGSSSGASGDEEKAKVPEQQSTEEEWKEFEEEQRKDYTGLKIGQLTLNDEDELTPTEGEDEDGDSEGVPGAEPKRVGGGPWKKVVPAEQVTQIPIDSAKSKYVSPALRQSQSAALGSRIRTRNRAAPDITNADYFPTLGAARPEEQRKKKNEPAFEEVRHGSRVLRVQEQAAAPVSVTNRFQSLDQDDS